MKLSILLVTILLISQNHPALCFGANSGMPNRQTKNPLPADDNLSLEIRCKTFDIVWEAIRDKYYDSRFNGVNWNAV